MGWGHCRSLHHPGEFPFQGFGIQIVVLDDPRPEALHGQRGELTLKPVRQLRIPDHEAVEGIGGVIVYPALDSLFTDEGRKGQHQECGTSLGEFMGQGGNGRAWNAGAGWPPRLGKGQQSQGSVAHNKHRMVGTLEPTQIASDHERENDCQQWTEHWEEREEETFQTTADDPLAITSGAAVHRDGREAPSPFLDRMTEGLPSLNQKIRHVILSGGISAQDHEDGWRRG